MFNYKEIIQQDLKNIDQPVKKLKVTSCTPKSFVVSNQNICTSYIATKFLELQIDYPVGLDFLKKPFSVIEEHQNYDLDLGTYKYRVYSTYSGIHPIFWIRKDNSQNTKYTKWFLYKTIVACYNIVSTIFVRAKLDLIYTDINLYYILFSCEHSYEISISLLDIFKRFGMTDDKQFARMFKRATTSSKKEVKQAEELQFQMN